ncbi:TnsD family Tn7-like transposition protein [Vibrio sp.]|uniref:TnsD family Tn7-like transposition protein n=1 Tax=Vibrio sp. TaxID=678 RepID=UPI00311E2E88
MLGLPILYPNELIYSLVARAKVHSGITSPKRLLDEIYADRNLIATVDLPSHLAEISRQYSVALNITVPLLIYRHTLFPLYAPFIEEKRRLAGIRWMENQSKGRIHLSFGVAASLVKQPNQLRYCPKCFDEQIAQYGERYWKRNWQVPGATWCSAHQIPLYEFSIPLNYEHRHEFHAASRSVKDRQLHDLKRESLRCSIMAKQLLETEPQESPTVHQWTCYYRDLIVSSGCNRGSNLSYGEVCDRIYSLWHKDWLFYNHLALSEKESCWVKSILRKHRKSFSFIQHMIIQSSLSDEYVPFSEVLTQVKQYPEKSKAVCQVPLSQKINRKKRSKWLTVLKKFGCAHAKSRGYLALYMWLYRHDYIWLMRVNKRYQRPMTYINNRVNWNKRDRLFVRKLSKLLDSFEEDHYSPRRSSTFLLSRLGLRTWSHRISGKLPLTRQFLDRYSESVEQYQIRRLTNQYISFYLQNTEIQRWRLLRSAGLSEERLTLLAQCFYQC